MVKQKSRNGAEKMLFCAVESRFGNSSIHCCALACLLACLPASLFNLPDYTRINADRCRKLKGTAFVRHFLCKFWIFLCQFGTSLANSGLSVFILHSCSALPLPILGFQHLLSICSAVSAPPLQILDFLHLFGICSAFLLLFCICSGVCVSVPVCLCVRCLSICLSACLCCRCECRSVRIYVRVWTRWQTGRWICKMRVRECANMCMCVDRWTTGQVDLMRVQECTDMCVWTD